MTTRLRVPAMPCVVEGGVFDAWSWCESDVLEWMHPAAGFDAHAPLDVTNPSDLVFVVHDADRGAFLPRELASLHAKGYGFGGDVWALAPYAIDDATDLLHERRVRPRDVLRLAAPSLPALVWGLHDWAHFHNHGPFDDPPLTELGCDLLALHWLRLERDVLGLGAEALARIAAELATITERRFAEAGRALPCDIQDVRALFAGPYPAEPVVRTSAA